VETVGRFVAEDDGALLLDHWRVLGADARPAALAVLRSRPTATRALLDAIESGRVSPGDLAAADIAFLWRNEDPEIGPRARRVLAAHRGASPESSLAALRPALDLGGDAARGRVLFEQRCQFCHRAAGGGVDVGPDLETVRGRGREGLLAAIVDPHREVAPAYVAYTVATRDGNRIEGIIRRDDASGMTLRLMGGVETTLARADIAGTSSAGRSLMPEGLALGLAPAQMADLLAFIESLGTR
jgi:putative heme-binding domain-containing protein